MSKNTITSEQAGEMLDKPFLSGNATTSQLRFLLGRVLTIIDASFGDKDQKKAIKDLVKGEFVETMSHITTLCLDGKEIELTDEEVAEVTEVDINEIIA